MTKFAFIFMIALLVLNSEVLAQQPVDEIDLEVVRLLNLNQEQAIAYSTIMQQQRAAYSTLKPRRWEQQKAFYDETFARLKPVLTGEQYIRFVAYMDSFLEAIPDENLLVME
jgi:hypothetical protein